MFHIEIPTINPHPFHMIMQILLYIQICIFANINVSLYALKLYILAIHIFPLNIFFSRFENIFKKQEKIQLMRLFFVCKNIRNSKKEKFFKDFLWKYFKIKPHEYSMTLENKSLKMMHGNRIHSASNISIKLSVFPIKFVCFNFNFDGKIIYCKFHFMMYQIV